MGVLSETFETAITWERLPGFVAEVAAPRAQEALGEGTVTVPRHARLSRRRGAVLHRARARRAAARRPSAGAASSAAASEAILAAGGTITHHHAVGRDHRP